MSVVKDIYKYLDIESDNIYTSDYDDSFPSITLDSGHYTDYEGDASSDSEASLNDNLRDFKVKPLDSLSRSDVSIILNFTSKIVSLMCRLTCNLKSDDDEVNIYINDTKELIEVLENPPEKYSLMKNKACSEILINAQAMKNSIVKGYDFT